MAYDTQLAERLELATSHIPDIQSKKMFGGIAFLYKGKMTVGVMGERLMVRVIEDKYLHELQNTYVQPMDFTGKVMKEFITVSPEGFDMDKDLEYYIQLGLEHAKNKLGEK